IPPMKPLSWIPWLLLAALAGAPAAAAEDAQRDRQPGSDWEILRDPHLRKLLELERIARFEDLAPLWDWTDPELQRQVTAALARLRLEEAARNGRLAVVF